MARITALWFSVPILGCIAAWLAFSHIRYESRVDRARLTFSDAAALEKAGQVQAAYRRYSTLCEGSFEIKRHDVPTGACDGAARLSRNMTTAYEHTMAALERYRKTTGRYPESLSAVAGDIPKSSVAAFSGFTYFRKGDTEAAVATGQYGHVTFDLGRR